MCSNLILCSMLPTGRIAHDALFFIKANVFLMNVSPCLSEERDGENNNNDDVLDRDQIEKDSHSFSFTLVMTSTYVVVVILLPLLLLIIIIIISFNFSSRERIPFIPFFLQRWPSFIALSIQCREHEVTEVVSTLQDLELPDRVTVIIYPVGNANHKFYVNKLRNIAISSIRTTHFLTLDMDMWPTRTYSHYWLL